MKQILAAGALLAATTMFAVAGSSSAGADPIEGTASCVSALDPTPQTLPFIVDGTVELGPYAPGEEMNILALSVGLFAGGGPAGDVTITVFGQAIDLGDAPAPGDPADPASTAVQDITVVVPDEPGTYEVAITDLSFPDFFVVGMDCTVDGDVSLGTIEVAEPAPPTTEPDDSTPSTTPEGDDDTPGDDGNGNNGANGNGTGTNGGSGSPSPAKAASPVSGQPSYTG